MLLNCTHYRIKKHRSDLKILNAAPKMPLREKQWNVADRFYRNASC